MKIIFNLVVIILLIFSSGIVLAHEGDDLYSHHEGMMSGTLWGSTSGIFLMGLFGWLFMILIIVIKRAENNN